MQMMRPIHPFPARMAPEIALRAAQDLASGSLVLDPMAGSGTVLRAAAECGHRAVGFDVDPLAVLMARVWTTPVDGAKLRGAAERLVAAAGTVHPCSASLPWIDDDAETRAFVDYWFAEEQQYELRGLSYALREFEGPLGDALRIALSRIIVTKDRGASLARDTSHSRPHRVYRDTHFRVPAAFLLSAHRLAAQLEAQPPAGNVTVRLGDARRLGSVESSSIDAVITSPPYLNAIDYLRGHRLSLVWLGYTVGELRAVRSGSIGTERQPSSGAPLALATELAAKMPATADLPPREKGMVYRYVLDTHEVMAEICRVLRPGGRAIYVIGNSSLKQVFVENALLVLAAATRLGLRLVAQRHRDLPASRRYLPPPRPTDGSSLRNRMRTESVLIFVRV